jgi:hypothetical protein
VQLADAEGVADRAARIEQGLAVSAVASGVHGKSVVAALSDLKSVIDIRFHFR